MEGKKEVYSQRCDIGIFLLWWMTGIVVITPILFAIGISISYLNVVCPFLIVAFIFFGKNKYGFWKNIFIVGCSVVIVIVIMMSCGSVFDQTWDGAAYHKTAVGLLKEGWNPLYNTAFEFNEKSGILPYAGYNPVKYAEAYPKASWYIAASIYYITGNIECGKAYTLFFFSYYIFYHIGVFFEENEFTNKGKGICSACRIEPHGIGSDALLLCGWINRMYIDNVNDRIINIVR